MGACYSVELKVNVLDMSGAIKALNEHIVNDTSVDYSLDEYAEMVAAANDIDGDNLF